MRVEDHTTIVKGLRVYYRIAGDQKNPPLILLNGWGAKVGGPILSSDKVIMEFGGHKFYIISPEHPGLMRSETPKTIWGPKEYKKYLEEFIDKLGLNNFVLVGQSFGGSIATTYAAEHPEKIKTLVLVNAGLTRDKAYRFVFRRFIGIHYLSQTLRSKYVPAIFKKMLLWLALGVPWNYIKEEKFEARAIMGDIFRKWSLPNVYANIRVRTILVWGSGDALFPLSSAKEVEKEISNAELYAVFGGHSVLYAQPKKIVGLIVSKL